MKRMPQRIVVLDYPFHGRWLARNSPARRVPSHGTHLFGTTYAIDFIGVDERGRSAARTWRTLLTVERPELFVGFGRPVLAPVGGRVAALHDAEPDHAARRSQLALLPYALRQPQRVRTGGAAIAGNHVVIASVRQARSSYWRICSKGRCWSDRVTPSSLGTGSAVAATPATAPNRTCTSRSPTRSTGRALGVCRWRLLRRTAPSECRASPRSWSSINGDRSAPVQLGAGVGAGQRRRPSVEHGRQLVRSEARHPVRV